MFFLRLLTRSPRNTEEMSLISHFKLGLCFHSAWLKPVVILLSAVILTTCLFVQRTVKSSCQRLRVLSCILIGQPFTGALERYTNTSRTFEWSLMEVIFNETVYPGVTAYANFNYHLK